MPAAANGKTAAFYALGFGSQRNPSYNPVTNGIFERTLTL